MKLFSVSLPPVYGMCQTLSGGIHVPCKDFYSIGFYEAYLMAIHMASRDSSSITECDICSLHATAMRGIKQAQPGTYRTESVCMRGTGYTFPPAEEIKTLMAEYCDSTKTIIEQNTPPTAAALLHQSFVGIHPFLNGNGRVARLVMNVVLLRGGYHALFVQAEWSEAYHRALEAVQNGVDSWTFVEFIQKKVQENQHRFSV